MDFLEERLETLFKGLVLGALIVLADEVAASGQGIEAKGQCCVAEILEYLISKYSLKSRVYGCKDIPYFQHDREKPYH